MLHRSIVIHANGRRVALGVKRSRCTGNGFCRSMVWSRFLKGSAVVLLLATSGYAASADTVSQLFPSPPLTPLVMRGADGTHVFTSLHTGVFNGKRVRYKAVVEETVIELAENGDQIPAAHLYTMSYLAKGQDAQDDRPVMFIFNGGPGASSVFLHLCGLGPKKLRHCNPHAFTSPNVRLVDNHRSPLDVVDLVFVDPTDTGWSHTLPGVNPQRFHSVFGDSDSVTALIVWWLKKHERLDSPVYIYGESYGSMRAVAVARDLARSEPQVIVDGLLLGGFAITFGSGGSGTDPLWEALRLPAVASLAWHYGKIDNQNQSWVEAVKKASAFARTEYLGALIQGYSLETEKRKHIIERVSELSGISASYFISHHTLLVSNFKSALLHEEGRVMNGGNGLWSHPSEEERPEHPYAAFSSAMNSYAREFLNVTGISPYHVTTPNGMRVFRKWNFRIRAAPDLSYTLAKEMREHEKLRLLVIQGRYDTQTQLGHTRYILNQTDLPRQRFAISYFNGGHMLEPKPDIMEVIRQFVLSRDLQGTRDISLLSGDGK